MRKLDFDDWLADHHKEISKLNENEIINQYLDYFIEDKRITWGEGIILDDKDLNEEKLSNLISKFNKDTISLIDYNEDHIITNIGKSMFTKICELYHSTNIPTHPDGYYENNLLNIHPILYKYLKKWLDLYISIMGWDESAHPIKELFWNCFK